MHGSAHLANGATRARVRRALPRLLGVTEESPTGSRNEARRRLRALTSIEALAVAQLKRFAYDRRAARLGKAAGDLDPQGRVGPEGRGTQRYDARIVRVIDFERALDAVGGHNAALLQMYYCDGESPALIGEALGVTAVTIRAMLGPALKLLVHQLESRLLL